MGKNRPRRPVFHRLVRTAAISIATAPPQVASEEAANNKTFIGFIALIIRCRIYTTLKDKAGTMVKKPNYFTVPAAIRELEKKRDVQAVG